MKVLVTGGAGFIGSHIVEYFQHHAEVVVLDNLRTGFEHNLDGLKCEFVRGSILDRDLLKQILRGVDFVFHLAAMVSVPESMNNPIECAEINTIGTLAVLEQAAKARVRKFVLSSSAAIYGDNPLVPKLETMMPEPKSPYGVSKLDGELYCQIFSAAEHMQTACLRYFNVFGPRQNPASQYAAAVPIFIEHAIKNQPLTIFGDGDQTRDFVYVKDIVAANVFFATQSAASGIFNVACGRRITVNELANTIVRLTGSRGEIRHAAMRAGDIKHSVASVNKLSAAGFSVSDNFQMGLQETIDFFRGKAQWK